MNVPFSKLAGTGNDFLIIDHRRSFLPPGDMPEFVRKVCRRAQSVGADGVIFVEQHPQLDFAWRFFNADGGEAEMCGNGARCVSRFAFARGLAGKTMRFQTVAGVIESQILDERRVKVRLTRAHDDREISLSLPAGDVRGHMVNTGVPHVVVPVTDVNVVDVETLGAQIRYAAQFAPAGTNANFVQVAGEHDLVIRTYERGVEGETLACGTGCVAAATMLVKRGLVKAPVNLRVRSGETLTVHFSGEDPLNSDAWLEGPTQWICDGELRPEAWQGA